MLLGQFGEDDNTKTCIYWSSVAGSRKVILRKVDTEYTPVKEKTFVLYKGSNTSAYVVKDKVNNTSEQLNSTSLQSLDNGVFWIGTLPYGWYIIEETDPKTLFYLVITANGTFEGPATAGGMTRTAAETEAQALYQAKK